MIGRRLSQLVAVGGGVLLLAGCGMPDKVTYVDPNPANSGTAGTAIDEPVARRGADTTERMLVLMRMRARLLAARTVLTSSKESPADDLAALRDADWPLLEPYLRRADGTLAESMDRAIDRLAANGDTARVGQIDELTKQLGRAERAVAGNAALTDPGFRAALVHEMLAAASVAYESALPDGKRIASVTDYRLVYGYLRLASERVTMALEPRSGSQMQSQIDRLALRSTPSPVPPEDPDDTAAVGDKLGRLQDQIDEYANIDVTRPEPRRAAVADMKKILTAFEDAKSLDTSAQLAAIDRAWTALQTAAPTIAGVDPSMLTTLEHLVGVEAVESTNDGNFAEEADSFISTVAESREAIASEVELYEQED